MNSTVASCPAFTKEAVCSSDVYTSEHGESRDGAEDEGAVAKLEAAAVKFCFSLEVLLDTETSGFFIGVSTSGNGVVTCSTGACS